MTVNKRGSQSSKGKMSKFKLIKHAYTLINLLKNANYALSLHMMYSVSPC